MYINTTSIKCDQKCNWDSLCLGHIDSIQKKSITIVYILEYINRQAVFMQSSILSRWKVKKRKKRKKKKYNKI